jgi:hypothetical protein
MEKTYVIKRGDRYYKVKENTGENIVLLTRLNSADPNDIFKPLDSFEEDLNLALKNDYKIVKGGKKTRSNKKYKKKSKTKRRRCHR